MSQSQRERALRRLAQLTHACPNRDKIRYELRFDALTYRRICTPPPPRRGPRKTLSFFFKFPNSILFSFFSISILLKSPRGKACKPRRESSAHRARFRPPRANIKKRISALIIFAFVYLHTAGVPLQTCKHENNGGETEDRYMCCCQWYGL